MKWLGIFLLLPPNGMLVHHRSQPQHLIRRYPVVRETCLTQENNTMSPARFRTQTAQSKDEFTEHQYHGQISLWKFGSNILSTSYHLLHSCTKYCELKKKKPEKKKWNQKQKTKFTSVHIYLHLSFFENCRVLPSHQFPHVLCGAGA